MMIPAKSFREIVTDIENARAVMKHYVSFLMPFLNSKVLDLGVTSTQSRTRLVSHSDGSLVVNEQGCHTRTDGDVGTVSPAPESC